MGWLVLVVLLLGASISVIAGTYSHGLAAIGATLHGAPSLTDPLHGHGHEDHGGESASPNHSGGISDHPHHGADHAHDTAHALPGVWTLAVQQLSLWEPLVRPWIETARAFRLERPPMG